ncbi:hypothetical protein [Phytohabitans houttuyneae]|uniref:Uncharacterized protein n=1 Tax=Phytohabitans houttuyneae TaxID=1076126 RepID=A0A6V8KGS6_9ACTN|nr:hypothetical protein [Phytohabitans houttuyneae]GFJ81289.1 hypothetical protein Phou_054690 [Phytohabitans houttuyneae]
MTTTGTTAKYLREIDRLPDGGPARVAPIDTRALIGTWRNANHQTWGISTVELTERDGQVWAHAWAVDPHTGRTRDWGEVLVDGLYALGPTSNDVCGYRATFELGHARTQIQANMLHSVMVCGAFTTFTDGSGRADYFSREFLHRRGPQSTMDTPADGIADQETRDGIGYARGDDRLPMLRAPIVPDRLLTRWRNTDAGTTGISEVELHLRDGQTHLRVTAVGPDGSIDWGDAPVRLYTDISVTGGGRSAADPTVDGRPTPHYADVSATDGGPALFATFDHGFMRVHMQARFNIGILPFVMFNEFSDDSGRQDYFQREVFVR